MPLMPFHILGLWFRSLLSVAVLAGGLYLLHRWYEESHVVEPALVTVAKVDDAPRPEGKAAAPDGPVMAATTEERPARTVFRFEPGWNRPTALLASALALLAWAVVGRWLYQGASSLISGAAQGAGTAAAKAKGQAGGSGASGVAGDSEGPDRERGGEVRTIVRPDGSVLNVEIYGPADAPPLVLTHGWGSDATEWYYFKKHMAGPFRVIVWDEAGLGKSKKPDNNDYRMEKFAADLEAVLGVAGGRPAVLLGHSIGGMIILTFCRLFPEALGSRVAGIALVHTTYMNPLRTAASAWLYTALEKPLVVPLLHVTIALWPLAWALNWMSYFNGSAHRSAHKQSFAGTETPAQLNFVARFIPMARPDVLARGMFGMMHFDETSTLATVPIPALVVIADQDTTTVPEAGQFMQKHLPKGQLATLAPARHMGVIERHEELNRVVTAFATSCQSPAGVTGGASL